MDCHQQIKTDSLILIAKWVSNISIINRRMRNSALQTEKDLIEPEIQPNLPENCQFSAHFVPKIYKNVWSFPS